MVTYVLRNSSDTIPFSGYPMADRSWVEQDL